MTDELRDEQALAELNRALELRVQEQARELEAIFDALPIGLVVIDTELKWQRWNPRALEILGAGEFGEPDVLRRYTTDGELQAREEWAISRAIHGEEFNSLPVVVEVPDGRRLRLEVAARPIRDEHGAVQAAVITFEDVTERDERERADRDFIANAAHQIRSPLTAIASSVAVLQGGAKDDPPAREQFLAHLEREVGRLVRLGDALLMLARIQRGHAQAEFGVVSLHALCTQATAGIEPPDGVELVVECEEDAAAVTNAALLEQALGNLLANALAHTTAGTITVGARVADARAILEVTDTGPGMSPETQRQVLGRFHRGSSQSRTSGFGLGLPIAEEAVRAAGGTLELVSEEERGTTARIALTAARIVR